MSAASLALQKAMVAALRASPAVMEVATGVFDMAAPDQPCPHVVFTSDQLSDWSHKTGAGRSHQVRISIWDDAADSLRLRRLMAAVEDAVLALPPELEGHRLVAIGLSRSRVVKDPAGPNQGMMEFRALTLAA